MIFIKVVCLFFLYISLSLIIGIVLSKIKIRIDELKIDTDRKKENNLNIKIEIYLFQILKIYSLKIDSKNYNLLLDRFDYKKAFLFEIKEKIKLKDLNLKLDKFQMDLNLGLKDAIITGETIAILSTILSIILNHNSIRHYYKIFPIYQNRNVIKLKLKGIISFKPVHILYVIILKIRRNKNGRTSNRRAYANSNE